MLNIVELKSKKLTELQEIAKHLDIPKFRYVNKPELIDLILKNQKKDSPTRKKKFKKTILLLLQLRTQLNPKKTVVKENRSTSKSR